MYTSKHLIKIKTNPPSDATGQILTSASYVNVKKLGKNINDPSRIGYKGMPVKLEGNRFFWISLGA